MRALVASALCLAACGGPSAGPDLDAAPADAGPPDAGPAGTWDDPIDLVISDDDLHVGGDTAAGEARAHHYACAPSIDQTGPEIVFRVNLDAPTTVRLGVATQEDPTHPGPVDVDVYVVSGPPDANGDVVGCLARVDRALETELPAGTSYLVGDTFMDLAGDFGLSVVRAEPGACLENPLPECTAETLPYIDGNRVEPLGIGGCPAGMNRVDTFCIDRYEASLVLDEEGRGWSPFENPGNAPVRAISAHGAPPQGYINQTQAAAACDRAGKRLCTDAEWLRACQGAAGHTYPYGDTRIDGACNDARECHPAVQYFESSDPIVFSMIDHPCLGQLPDGLASPGAYITCASDDGVFDMMGNLHEWTADPAGTFRGGFFVDTQINGEGCLYATTAHDVSHWDYSTGFRCCADL
jgi:sulfatase modifying factor 1